MNSAGARGKDCPQGAFFGYVVVCRESMALFMGLQQAGNPSAAQRLSFLIDNSSHLNDIFSFKANTAFPCNKPNKIKYQEETC